MLCLSSDKNARYPSQRSIKYSKLISIEYTIYIERWLVVYASRFPPLPQVIDVIPKESKLKVGRLNNLGFENQKIKE